MTFTDFSLSRSLLSLYRVHYLSSLVPLLVPVLVVE